MIRVFLNVKGGVAKTTSAINIAKGFANNTKRVLLIDLDGQSSASSIILGNEYWGEFDWYNLLDEVVNKKVRSKVSESERLTISSCLNDPSLTKKAIIKTKFGFDIIPSELSLFETETRIKLQSMNFQQAFLYNAIKDIIDDYDEVIIDCNPSLDMLAINAIYTLKNGGEVVIPTEMQISSLLGVRFTIMAIEMINSCFGFDIGYKLLAVMVQRNKDQRAKLAQVRELFKDRMFETSISYQSKPATQGNDVAYNDGLKMIVDSNSTIGSCYKELLKEMEGE